MYVNNEDNILSMHMQRLACLLVPWQCDIAKNLSLAQVVFYMYTLWNIKKYEMSRCLSSPVQEMPKLGYWDKTMSGVSDASPNVK